MDEKEAKTEKITDKMDKSLLILTGVAVLIGIIIVLSCYVRRRDRVIYLCKGKGFYLLLGQPENCASILGFAPFISLKRLL